MSRPSSVFLIALPLVIILTLSSSAQTSWHQVTDREAGFTISFPGRPTYQVTDNPSIGLQTEIYKFFYSGRLLRITFAPLSQPVRTPTELSRAYSNFSQQVVPRGGTLLWQQKLPDGGRQYDTVEYAKEGTIYSRTRLYIRNGRYYAVAFEMYGQGRLDEPEAERFLSSFSFLDAMAKRRDTTRNNLPTINTAKPVGRARWYSFRAPDGDFTVEFPGKPTYKLDQSSGVNASLHRYHYFYGENIFQISYQEFSEVGTHHQQVLRRAIETYTSVNEGRRVMQQKQIPNGAYQIDSQGTSDGVPFYSRVWLFVRGTRIYHVTALTPNLVGPNKNDVTRFFESFRFQ